jgi:hypothetical protein
MSLPDLRGLFAALDAAHVEFVVIGGIALGLHGFLRTTEDLDIVPDPDPANLDRLCSVLEAEEAKLLLNQSRRFGSREGWMLRRGRNVSISTRHGDLDIVRSLPGVPDYPTLVADAERYDVDGMSVTVASADKLIGMKQARGSKQDAADIEALEALTEESRPPASSDDVH